MPSLSSALVSSVVAVSVVTALNLDFDLDSDDHKLIQQLIQEKGYPCEKHYILTPDGYQLGTIRIAYGRNENASALSLPKPPVILQHGLLDSAYTWTVNSPTESLAYILADAGYDVWMPNNRGNDFSKKNIYVHTKTDQFWNLTFDEMARYDVPSVIDYILDYTSQPQVAWVGHSEGTIQMFAAPYYDTNNELPKKVALFGALAPVAYVYHCESPVFRALAELGVDEIIQDLGVRQFFPGTGIHVTGAYICDTIPHGCDLLIETLVGPSSNLNESRIQVYTGYSPADTSVKNMVHWAQGIRADTFSMYDYGSASANEAIYGPSVTKPPAYDLSQLAIPTVLYSGTNDVLADPVDVRRLVSEMNPDYIVDHKVITGYAHLDFVWGYNANTHIYDDLVSRIAKFLGSGVKL